MKQGEFKYQSVKIPLYHDRLHIAVGHDIAAICRAADLPANDLNGASLSSYLGYAFTGIRESTVGYFAFFAVDAGPGTVAHEALHLCHKLMMDRGIKVDADNDEPQAYLLGWMVEQMHEVFNSKDIKPVKAIKLA